MSPAGYPRGASHDWFNVMEETSQKTKNQKREGRERKRKRFAFSSPPPRPRPYFSYINIKSTRTRTRPHLMSYYSTLLVFDSLQYQVDLQWWPKIDFSFPAVGPNHHTIPRAGNFGPPSRCSRVKHSHHSTVSAVSHTGQATWSKRQTGLGDFAKLFHLLPKSLWRLSQDILSKIDCF